MLEVYSVAAAKHRKCMYALKMLCVRNYIGLTVEKKSGNRILDYRILRHSTAIYLQHGCILSRSAKWHHCTSCIQKYNKILSLKNSCCRYDTDLAVFPTSTNLSFQPRKRRRLRSQHAASYRQFQHPAVCMLHSCSHWLDHTCHRHNNCRSTLSVRSRNDHCLLYSNTRAENYMWRTETYF